MAVIPAVISSPTQPMSPVDELVVSAALGRGWLTQLQVDAANAAREQVAANATARPGLVEVLVGHGAIDPRQIADLLAVEFGLGRAPHPPTVRVSDEVLALVPANVARRYFILPLERTAAGLRVAIADPVDFDGIDALTQRLGLPIEPMVATAGELATAIERNYGASADSSRPPGVDDPAKPETREATAMVASPADTLDGADAEAPIVELVHRIIAEAIARRASDIHLEPLEHRFRVRYRVDGVLIEVENPPKPLQAPILSRLKIMANLSIAEKRLPQDGRMRVAIDGRQLDLRVSSLPTAHGESMVMRILDQEGTKYGLAELGLGDDDAARLKQLITLPDGLLLVTGPTGSGKTTTLYSCLHALNEPGRKIITVEDPVEYQINGINQVPVHHEVGMTFASALRAMLRQAPNVVMVGEIRDRETAEIAIHASLTGHLVVSTLHTNDATSAITRLIDLGVKPFLVASALRGVLAQRLVRRICRHCRRWNALTSGEIRMLDLASTESRPTRVAHGQGCPECAGTGFRGRVGIFELLRIDESLQTLIHQRSGTATLRERACALGLRTLRADGVRKVTAGLTTVEEVVSITVADGS